MLRLQSTIAATITLSFLLGATPAVAATAPMTITLMPHCTEQDRTKCPTFPAADGQSLKTGRLSAGDILDIDVVVKGPSYASVRAVRAWLNYNAASLEARSVELTSAITSPTPGEQTIDTQNGIVKIGGSTNTLMNADVVVARVTFRVLSAMTDTTIGFHDYQPSGLGHTAVNGPRVISGTGDSGVPEAPCIDMLVGCKGSPEPLLVAQPTSLTVSLADPTALANANPTPPPTTVPVPTDSGPTMIPPSGTPPTGTPPPPSTDPIPYGGSDSAFALLQVQDVRVTSRENAIFLAWQPLRSAALAGYNVYYGTVSGRYIQRRSIDGSTTNAVIRDLQPGTPYFLAVRALSKDGQESVFSQEVSVTVGKPETATSPMTGDVSDVTPPKGNPVVIHGGSTVQGATGVSDFLIPILIVSAIVGTAFALRRQFAFRSLTTNVA